MSNFRTEFDGTAQRRVRLQLGPPLTQKPSISPALQAVLTVCVFVAGGLLYAALVVW